MTDPRAALALGAAVLLASCARVVAPAGGPEDLVPPAVVAGVPMDSATEVGRAASVRLEFSEWIDPSSAREVLSVQPPPSRTPTVEASGRTLELTWREPLDSGTTVVVRFAPGLKDWHGAGTRASIERIFSTGASLDAESLSVRVWSGGDSAAPRPAAARVGLYPVDPARRAGLHRLLRRRDSVAWLGEAPDPSREKPWFWVWADSTGRATFDRLPAGRWRLLAWDDRDKDGFLRSGEEAVAGPFEFDLPGAGEVPRNLLLEGLAPTDSVVADSVHRADSLRRDSIRDRIAGLPRDSVVELRLSPDSLPTGWSVDPTLRVRLWERGSRDPLLLVSTGSATLAPRLAPGSWSGEIWLDRDGDGRPGPTEVGLWRRLPLFAAVAGTSPFLPSPEPPGRPSLPEPARPAAGWDPSSRPLPPGPGARP